MTERLLYETHMHTPLCKHAAGEPEDYAAVAQRRGLRGIIVTCHNPMPNGFSASVRMAPEQFDDYVAMVERARDAFAGRVEVRLGIECDYFPGFDDFLKEQIRSQPFHYVLGSVHPQTKEYKQAFWKGDARAYFRQYYAHLAEAARTGLFDCLAHPDIVKNVAPSQWDPAGLSDDIRGALDAVAEVGMAMELNTSGLNKDLPEMNPGPVILAQMRQRDIPVVVGADAHVPDRVGDGFLEAYDLLEQAGYEEVSYFLGRVRQTVPIDAARASLAAVR